MEVNVHHIRGRTVTSAAALGTALILLIASTIASLAKDQDQDQHQNQNQNQNEDQESSDAIVEQGFAVSPIPENKLNLFGKDRNQVGLGSYLVNAAADCNGCHSFPRFLRPGGTVPGTNGNQTGNITYLGSNPAFGDPYLDPPEQSLAGHLKANHNIGHFLAGGRCFGFLQSRNLTP